MFGDGEQTRDYVYVGDVVAAVLAAVGKGGVYNVGTGIETTVNELHRLCAEVVGSGQTPSHVDARAGDARRSVLDPSRAERELGWRAGTPLDDGLRLTWGHSRPPIRSRGSRRGPWRRCVAASGPLVLGRPRSSLALAPGRFVGPSRDLRRRLRRLERPPLPHVRAVGRALVRADLGERLRGGARGGRVLPALPRSRARARVGDGLDARRRHADLARVGRRRRGRARRAGAEAARRPGRAGRGALPRALPRRLRLHGRLLGRALPGARGGVVPRRRARPARPRRRARRPRDRDAADRARPRPRARAPALAWPRPACCGWRRSCSRPRPSGCTRSISTASSAMPAPSRARRRPGTATRARSGRSPARSTPCARPDAG